MDTSILTEALYCFCVLSVLLLAGTFLRAKVAVFRKLFLPASVIGGFIGLLLGPVIWGELGIIHIPFPQNWIDIWSALPGLLIIPVVACVPLGMKPKTKEEKKQGNTSSNVLKTFGIIAGVTVLQGIIGLITQAIYNYGFSYDLYPTFGYEVPSGFSGGHGTAGVIGSYYKSLELVFWETAQGVTTTTATFGLVCGMIIGIFAINVAARKGKTAVLKKPGDIPAEIARGLQMDAEKQQSLGRETTMSSSIETLSFHLAIVLTGCGIAYMLLAGLTYLGIPGLSAIPIWAYAILVMFAVNKLLYKLNLGSLIDAKTKSRIAGTCSDYAIAAAIASLPLKAVLQYAAPIITMVAIAITVTYFFTTRMCNLFFSDYKVERAMSIFGTSTGVFLTGLMLLRLCDPEFETPVLNDYSVGYSMTGVLSFILMAVFISLLLTYNVFINIAIQFGVFLLLMAVVLLAHKASKKTTAM